MIKILAAIEHEHIPSTKMLQLYCSVINGEPGLMTEAFSSIAARAASNPLSRYLNY